MVVRCNGCGKPLAHRNGMPREDALYVTKEWGYFSGRDGELHRFCLCQSCYEKMLRQFQIPVQVEELAELM
ncbi:hypothetical protein [Cuneatibacter caecimuris]|uniref:Uncharacterized protein n=1 Tax=Cuneatibacter caecimuris TaxID=1796618 RepID=A0A4Q7NZI9_9FIRM|nr:hypothetical protein [Cuneatibacter caecimuris]RZS91852.1 hypothetical protein EV209_3285 [Cuneatibacter caecimuris]